MAVVKITRDERRWFSAHCNQSFPDIPGKCSLRMTHSKWPRLSMQHIASSAVPNEVTENPQRFRYSSKSARTSSSSSIRRIRLDGPRISDIDSKSFRPIARLFDRIGLIALAATADRAGTQTGNLLLALAIARDNSERGESFSAIVEHFDDLLEAPPDIGELDVDPSRTDAVRLMNLHQVKGLEAPVVFLIDPCDEYEFPIDLFIDRSGDEPRGYAAITTKRAYSLDEIGVPLGWAAVQQTERAFRDAQNKRLLYVAATRAKNLLVVGFHNSFNGTRGAWRELVRHAKDYLFEHPESGRTSTVEIAPTQTFGAALEGIATRFAAVTPSSYSVLPIAKIAHKNHAELVRAEEGLGKGTSWGRVLHRLFEAMLRDASLDVRLYASNLLKDEERDAAELSEVLRAVEAVQSSALWSRSKSADERYVEIPFALNVRRRDVGLDEDGETLLHGTIDLVFREAEKWFIVDYKTDSTAGRLENLVTYYAPQVEHYARFWSELTEKPTTGGLFFIDGCIERWFSQQRTAR